MCLLMDKYCNYQLHYSRDHTCIFVENFHVNNFIVLEIFHAFNFRGLGTRVPTKINYLTLNISLIYSSITLTGLVGCHVTC